MDSKKQNSDLKNQNNLKSQGIQPNGNKDQVSVSFEPQESILITDPAVVPVLFHPVKAKILKKLIESEMTIRELSDEIDLNPGSVKRHLQSMMGSSTTPSKSDINEKGNKKEKKKKKRKEDNLSDDQLGHFEGLITQTVIKTNEYGIKLKFYRARAKNFTVSLEFPRDLKESIFSS
jgi:DNA-binding transcriptional ArsR family regulator